MRLAAALSCLLAFNSFIHADSLGKSVEPFALLDVEGRKVALSDFKDKKAVVLLFLGTQCPINNAYMPRLLEMHEEYAAKGVQFLAINSNEHDDKNAVLEHARKHKLPFPVLRDPGQGVADRLGATRVPEALLLDEMNIVRYQGRIDDQFGIGYVRPAPTRRDLAEAIDDVLAGRDVRTKTTPVAGCYITRAAKTKKKEGPTYAQVARIVQSRCAECHRPGQIGPMPLLNYEDVSSWSAMIHEVVAEKRMPPWLAHESGDRFRNDRSLTKEDRETLLAWIDAGCPKGDEAPPAPKAWSSDWSIGKPDAVFTMARAFSVPAKAPKGGVRYQHFIVPTNVAEDKWIQAAEVRPGNRAVVHHVIAYVTTGAKRPGVGEDGIGSGLLAVYVPGDTGVRFPAGMAKKLPKGGTIVFQMHYTPNGVATSDQTSIGLVFSKEPEHEMKTRAVSQTLILIPPGADNHRVESRSTFKKDTLVYSLFPHMHLRGKDFEYRAVFAEGKTEKLLSVPRYDFNWQDSYIFKEPLRMPPGSRIECTAHFDNSVRNFSNPDPKSWVRWGEQTWEEMMIGFVDYASIDADKK